MHCAMECSFRADNPLAGESVTYDRPLLALQDPITRWKAALNLAISSRVPMVTRT